MADERGAASDRARAERGLASERAKEKLERGAVDELEYDEITDVFDLISERVRDSTERACDAGAATAEMLKALAAEKGR